MRHYVVGFALNITQVALLTKAPGKINDGKLNGIGGGMHEGESALECMKRKGFKEAGFSADDIVWSEFLRIDYPMAVLHYFYGNTVKKNFPIHATENVCWYDIGTLDFKNCVHDLQWLLPMIVWHRSYLYINNLSEPAMVLKIGKQANIQEFKPSDHWVVSTETCKNCGDSYIMDTIHDCPRHKKTFQEVGTDIGKVVTEKNAAYGDSFAKCGQFLKLLYPNGILPDQYNDALALVRIFDKQMRIATERDAFGEDPYADIAGYGILGVVNRKK